MSESEIKTAELHVKQSTDELERAIDHLEEAIQGTTQKVHDLSSKVKSVPENLKAIPQNMRDITKRARVLSDDLRAKMQRNPEAFVIGFVGLAIGMAFYLYQTRKQRNITEDVPVIDTRKPRQIA